MVNNTMMKKMTSNPLYRPISNNILKCNMISLTNNKKKRKCLQKENMIKTKNDKKYILKKNDLRQIFLLINIIS